MKLLLSTFLLLLVYECRPQRDPAGKIAVIGYFSGSGEQVKKYQVEKLTHIIFSFCYLKGNQLFVANKKDAFTIKQLVALKKRKPSLKVLLSLGGWGGCKRCSTVFSTHEGRTEFAQSVKKLNDYFKTDGIDLDWEYPAIKGYPGHPYGPQDKHNFTLLVETLRNHLGPKPVISFAAGAFPKFLTESIEWDKVSPFVDKINLMTYDLINGNSLFTGHHTPLFSTPQQVESIDNAVNFLISAGVPQEKIVIGAAVYARVFNVEQDANNGLYQKGKFVKFIPFNKLNKASLKSTGFTYYWDEIAKAPYMYSSLKKQLITFDDERSVSLKTRYALDKKLGGIMFWQLAIDKPVNGLLSVIAKELD